ncbi:(2Fe-2S)-binding protein [Nocardioides terrisoli]|uniref:(2Fe-2S)-binding protein n=1 Tax=Nocardioides terrisoli TaxID=3388267 RepID=UPI00287B8589|nr:2Fe-2S iron-sulfur cluster-binding protein [Nocardioides marmorisolisilvae]
MRVSMNVNGEQAVGEVEPRLTLADHLRDNLGLTGTHLGCEQGACGACTVVMDGCAVRSCLILAPQAEGTEVATVEGLAADGELNRLQNAFLEHAALQCGFCTPGFLMSATVLLAEGARLDKRYTREEIRRELSGNVCRCTGYAGIVEAVFQCQG